MKLQPAPATWSGQLVYSGVDRQREHDCTGHVMIARKTGITFSDITRSPAPEAAWRMSAVYTRRGSAGIFASVSDGLAQVMAFD